MQGEVGHYQGQLISQEIKNISQPISLFKRQYNNKIIPESMEVLWLIEVFVEGSTHPQGYNRHCFKSQVLK